MLSNDFVSSWCNWYDETFCSQCDQACDDRGFDEYGLCLRKCGMDDNPHNCSYCLQQEHACRLFDLMAKQHELETMPFDTDEPLEVTLAQEREFDQLSDMVKTAMFPSCADSVTLHSIDEWCAANNLHYRSA